VGVLVVEYGSGPVGAGATVVLVDVGHGDRGPGVDVLVVTAGAARGVSGLPHAAIIATNAIVIPASRRDDRLMTSTR
jgi:hypothetical protein